MDEKTYLAVEDLDVYRKLCDLHLEVCDLTHRWPKEELYELGSQARRSSNSSPSQLAEKNDDRHVRNKIEGVNRARGEAAETVHHLYIALRKQYIQQSVFDDYKERYQECIRMLNGLERTLEKKLPPSDRRWSVSETPATYSPESELCPPGYPDTRNLNTDTLCLKPET
jgi:four helix bundle protein